MEFIDNLFIAVGFISSVLLGMVIIPNILFVSYKKRLFDEPDARKVHKIPIPRLGGLSFFPVILIVTFLNIGLRYLIDPTFDFYSFSDIWLEFLFVFAGLTMLYLIGEADDLVGVGYRTKFIVQSIASVLMIFSGNYLQSLGGLFGIYEIPVWIGVPLTLFIVVYITNAINLIDGIDGLASGLSCMSLIVVGCIFITVDNYIYALLSLVTFGTIIPFWFYNVFGNEKRGHKLFMGDAGSLTLGYILSFVIIRLSSDSFDMESSRKMIIAFSTLIVPLFDVVRVSLHRIRKGRNPFLPDRNHFHHKLLRTGMRTRYVLIFIMLTVSFFIGLNAFLLSHVGVTLLLFIDIAVWTLMHLAINRRIRIYAQTDPDAARSV